MGGSGSGKDVRKRKWEKVHKHAKSRSKHKEKDRADKFGVLKDATSGAKMVECVREKAAIKLSLTKRNIDAATYVKAIKFEHEAVRPSDKWEREETTYETVAGEGVSVTAVEAAAIGGLEALTTLTGSAVATNRQAETVGLETAASVAAESIGEPSAAAAEAVGESADAAATVEEPAVGAAVCEMDAISVGAVECESEAAARVWETHWEDQTPSETACENKAAPTEAP